VHSLPEGFLQTYGDRWGGDVVWHRMPRYRQGFVKVLLRRAFLWGHMRACGTKGMRLMLDRYPPRGWSAYNMVARVAWNLSKMCNTHSRVQRLVTLHDRLVERAPAAHWYLDLWRRISPDVILSADQRPVEVVPAVLAGKRLGIPTGTFVFSWDNLSSKSRMPTDFDFYLVWSPLMRDELLRFYPNIRDEQVYIVGTPQFDYYADGNLIWERERFCREVGADPNRPVICYAGEDLPTVPDAPAHLALLCDLVRQGKIHNGVQILARHCPAEDGSRYHEVLREYPEVIWCPPRWWRPRGGSWQQAVPMEEDTALLTNIIRHSSLCVNVTSTMTLDFAVMDKPSVNIAFDVTQPPPHGMPVWDFLFQFDHYQPVIELGAARFARSPDELAEHVNAYLENPSLDREARRKLVELEVGVPIGSSSERIVQVLAGIAGTGKCTSASSAVNTQA
jgi:hypothetical protein